MLRTQTALEGRKSGCTQRARGLRTAQRLVDVCDHRGSHGRFGVFDAQVTTHVIQRRFPKRQGLRRIPEAGLGFGQRSLVAYELEMVSAQSGL